MARLVNSKGARLKRLRRFLKKRGIEVLEEKPDVSDEDWVFVDVGGACSPKLGQVWAPTHYRFASYAEAVLHEAAHVLVAWELADQRAGRPVTRGTGCWRRDVDQVREARVFAAQALLLADLSDAKVTEYFLRHVDFTGTLFS